MLKKYLREQGIEQSELEKERQESRIYNHQQDYTWDGIEIMRYKPAGDSWDATIRQVLIGYREDTKFHVRYFEIAPGGHSSLEKHQHSHAVTIIRGSGKVLVGQKVSQMGYLDTVYISPDTAHQFINDGTEPFGFICVVDAERDAPRDLADEEIAALEANPAVKEVIRTGRIDFIGEK